MGSSILLQQPSLRRDPQPHWRGHSLVPSSPRWWCQGAESVGLCTKQPAHGLVPFGGLWGVCWYCPHSRGWFVVGLEGASSP